MYIQETSPVISHTTFVANSGFDGGALFCSEASPLLDNCTSYRNMTDAMGGMLHGQRNCHPKLSECTIAYERCLWGTGAAIHLTGNCSLIVEKSIIAYCEGHETISFYDLPEAYFSCSNLYGNGDGDWAGYLAEQLDMEGNISADPQFTNGQFGSFYLQPYSPCRADSSECGRMGAWEVWQ